jgi:hypothetical protein
MSYLYKRGNIVSRQHLADLVEGHMVVRWEGEQAPLPSGPGDPLQWMVSLKTAGHTGL